MEPLAAVSFEITYRKALAGGYAVFRATGGTFDAEPGQFAMIRGDWGFSPLLARPFSLAAVESGEVTLLVRIVGEGSRRLSLLQRGDRFQMHGPLGRPFRPVRPGERVLLVGGGVGIAPLLFLARRTRSVLPDAVTVVYGGRTRRDLPLAEECAKAASSVTFATEDGSAGEKGLATDAAAALVERGGFDRIAACGPWPMMAAVARLAARVGLPCEVSLESLMACGFGICLGCNVRTPAGCYLYACSDGPVVDAMQVDWETGQPFIPQAGPKIVAAPRRSWPPKARPEGGA